MATELVMPKLGWTMEEGILVEWMKKDGEAVKEGDILFTVESDKALNEVEAFDNGILRIPPTSPAPGSTIPVGGLLAYIVQPGETPPFETGGTPEVAPNTQTAPAQGDAETSASVPATVTAAQTNGDMPNISPRARRVARELGVNWSGLQGSGRTGRIIERDVRAAHEQRKFAPAATPTAAILDISPVARRAAQELGVDVGALATQFPGRRITREDVEAAANAPAPVLTAQPSTSGARTTISSTRRIISERMANSAHTTAPVTLTTEVDATELVNLRKQLKADASRAVPSYNDILAKLVSVALGDHLMLNARFDGDSIVQSAAVHIGLAVDTDRGLLVPVIRDVQDKSLRAIAAESARLIEGARKGALRGDELSGSTFSISNLGMYEIDAFTPIINLPECAILGVGRIVPKPVVVDTEAERVAIRHMLFLSLTFDHRLVDGAPAARFLQRVKQFVEQPYLWMVG